MKKFITGAILALTVSCAHSQTASVNWGDDFKMRKGTTDLSVMFADKTGVFVKQGHTAHRFINGKHESATLVKLDKSFSEEYHNDFNKELKGKDFEDFFFLKNKAFVMASNYEKKDRTLHLFSAEIDKGTGELAGDWKEVTSWQKDEKGDDLDFKMSYNPDSSAMIIVSTDEGKTQSSFEIKEFDVKMTPVHPTVSISTTFDSKTFQLEDVIYTSSGNIVLVGRENEYAEGKKKKAKNLEFKDYVVRLYGPTGTLTKEISTAINGKWLVSTKVAQIPNKDVVLAAFYSDKRKAKEINGLFVQRIDPSSGDVITTSQQELSTAMINAVDSSDDNDDDDDADSKKERKERQKLEKIQNEDEGFSRYMQFRDFVYTEDKGIVILAEKYHHYTYTQTDYGSGGVPGLSGRSTIYAVYDCEDMMMAKMDAAGKINWLHVLPKRQHEVIPVGQMNPILGGSFFTFSVGTGYFADDNFPFYAGVGSMALASKNTVAIMFNDNTKNEDVMQLGQKVKRTLRFGKGDCYVVYLDAATGKYKRVSMFSNHDQPTAMPRLGVAIGKQYYLVGKDDKNLGKSKIAVGTITFK